MGNVTAEKCSELMGAKASCSGTKWFLRIMLAVILVTAGAVGVISRNQGVNAGDIKVNANELKSQKERDAIGQEHRRTARDEDRQWQRAVMDKFDKIEEKQDTAIEKFLTHKHE